MQYPVIIERGETSFGAFVPDLPGCVAAADDVEEVKSLIRRAIELHIQGMLFDGDPIPLPGSANFADELDETTEVTYVEVDITVKAH